MPSTIPTSEKKKKSSKSSSKNKKSSKRSDDQLLGEPVKSTKSKKSKSSKKLKDQLPINDTQDETASTDDNMEGTQSKIEEVADEGENKVEEVADEATHDKVEELNDNAEQADGELEKIKDQVDETANNDDSDTEEEGDTDALTTMNAIMEYNRMLVQKLHDLEDKTGGLNKEAVQDTVKDTMNEVSAKYNSQEKSNGTQHSFELPIGDMMKSYGNFSSTPLSDENEKESTKNNKVDDEESTTVNGGDDGKIRIGDGEKDDIVVKVEATKTGITFSIHIPRN